MGQFNGGGGSGSGTVTHTAGNLTSGHIVIGNGTADAKVDSALVTDGAGALSGATSISTGTAPTACGSATGCFGATAASTASSQTASQGSQRLDTTHWKYRHTNGANEIALGTVYTLVSSGAIGALDVSNGPSQIVICSATCSMTPISPPVVGYQLCAIMEAGVTGTITLNALGNSAKYGKTDGSAYGIAGTGTMVSTSATGNRVCIVGSSSTTYETIGSNGSFTNS